MKVFSSEPLTLIKDRLRHSIREEDLLDENVFEEVWLPFGDDKETDINRLIDQNRIHR